MFGSDSTSAPMFNWIRVKCGINTLSDGLRGGLDEGKTGDEVVSELFS